jgi:hypothetical protein
LIRGQALMFPPTPATRGLLSSAHAIGGVVLFVQQQITLGTSTVFVDIRPCAGQG